MINIVIVDDDCAFLSTLSEDIRGYFTEKGEAYAIQTFTGAEEFLEDRKPFDIAFIDIQMERLTGMEAARRLRSSGSRGFIVFITVLPEYVYDAFEVDASDYLLKPVEHNRLTRTLDRLCRHIRTADTGSLLIPSKGNTWQSLLLRDIYYLEAVNHKIEFHTRDGVVEGYFRVSEIEALLDQRFFQCHRSYFINLAYVSGYNNGSALLTNGTRIPVSRLRRNDFSKAVLRHMKEKRDL